MNSSEDHLAQRRLDNAPIVDEHIRTKLRKTGKRCLRWVYGLKQTIPVKIHVTEKEVTEALRRHGYTVTRNGKVNATDWGTT